MIAPITPDRLLTEDIFSLLGLEAMPQSDRDELLQSMGQTVQARVYLRVSEELGPERTQQMDNLSVEEVAAFLEEQGIDLSIMTLDESLKYRAELVTSFHMATNPDPDLQPAV